MKIGEEYRKGNILILGFGDTEIFHELDKDYNALFGVSFDSKAVQKAYEEGFSNVFEYNIASISNLFSNNLFDTIILDNALHKVFTLNQKQGVEDNPINGGKKTVLMLSQVWDILADDGLLIIQDTMKPTTSFRYDVISYRSNEEFSEYLSDIGYVDETYSLGEDKEGITIMPLVKFISYAIGYLNKTEGIEYLPFDMQELQYYLSMVGFEILKADVWSEENLVNLAKEVSFYNFSHQNIIPNSSFLLKLRKK